MFRFIRKFGAASVLALGLATSAYAIPVTVNMTADNAITSGGLCGDASCTAGINWGLLGPLTNGTDWRAADTVALDLGPGTYYFAWQVENLGSPGSGNPAGLLAEILWDGQANVSSSAWEVYSLESGASIASATEYGLNGGANVWTSANGGAIAGISTDANWIYSANNFADADPSVWIRTSISIRAVPEPGVLGLSVFGLLATIGLAFRRRRA